VQYSKLKSDDIYSKTTLHLKAELGWISLRNKLLVISKGIILVHMRAGLRQYTVTYDKVLAVTNHRDIFFTSFYQWKQTKLYFPFHTSYSSIFHHIVMTCFSAISLPSKLSEIC